MELRPLDIVDLNRNIVARLYWSSPGVVTVESDNPTLKAYLENLVRRYSLSGIPSKTGGKFLIDGHEVYGTRSRQLTIDTPDFLGGIAEVLNEREPFPNQEVYGIIRRWKPLS